MDENEDSHVGSFLEKNTDEKEVCITTLYKSSDELKGVNRNPQEENKY